MSEWKGIPAQNTGKAFGIGKGELTIALSAAVFAAGLAAHYLCDPLSIAPGIMLVGFSALVGSYTNRIAIKALFDFWPDWPLVRSLLPTGLPFTGILKKKKDAIAEGLAAEITDLLSAEAFRAQVEEAFSSDSVKKALLSAAGGAGAKKMAEGLVDSKAFANLRNRLAQAVETAAAGSGADTVGKLLALPGFRRDAAAAVADRLEALADDPARSSELAAAVARQGAAALESPEAVRAVAAAVEAALPPGSALGVILDPSFAAHEIIGSLKTALSADNSAAAPLVRSALRAAADRARSLGADEDSARWASAALRSAFGIGASEAARALREGPPELRRRMVLLLRLGFRKAPAAAAAFLDLLESVPVAGGDLLDFVAEALSKKSSAVAAEKLRAMSTDEINRRIMGVSGDYLAWLEVYGGIMGAIGGVFMAAIFGWLGVSS